jgi:hypothetical protein
MVNGIWLVQPPLREAFLFIAIDGNDQLVEVPASRIFGVMSGKVNVMKAPETAQPVPMCRGYKQI